MHVSLVNARAVHRDGVVLRYALLGEMAYADVEIPSTGTAGTFVEEWCERPHWALTVSGSLLLEFEDATHPVPAFAAFHVPGGTPHRVRAEGAARIAAFEPVPADAPTPEDQLRAAGFKPLGAARARPEGSVAIVGATPERPPAQGETLAVSRRMGALLFTRTRFGRRAGFTSEPCDVPHWGLVMSGSVTIEWENDVEVVGAGDVFVCRAGPPAHRILAAERAVVVDLTPIEPLRAADRVASWRRDAAREALAEPVSPASRLQLASLA